MTKPVSIDAEVSGLVAAAEADAAQQPAKKPQTHKVYRTPDGQPMNLKHMPKMDLEVLRYANPTEWMDNVQDAPKLAGKKGTVWKRALVTTYDPDSPLPDVLTPSVKSPLCQQCALFKGGGTTPFMAYAGAEDPLVTIIVEAPGGEEDKVGYMLPAKGSISQIIEDVKWKTGIGSDRVRWLMLTRCHIPGKKKPNFKIKGNWCRWHVIDDLRRHPPKLIMAVGTPALGSLSHKSNAQDWGGKLLTYRGWPDDWLSNPKYALPQPDPLDPSKLKVGHPIFGPLPATRTLLYPIQSPWLVLMGMNDMLTKRWGGQIQEAIELARDGATPKLYTRPGTSSWKTLTTSSPCWTSFCSTRASSWPTTRRRLACAHGPAPPG